MIGIDVGLIKCLKYKIKSSVRNAVHKSAVMFVETVEGLTLKALMNWDLQA